MGGWQCAFSHREGHLTPVFDFSKYTNAVSRSEGIHVRTRGEARSEKSGRYSSWGAASGRHVKETGPHAASDHLAPIKVPTPHKGACALHGAAPFGCCQVLGAPGRGSGGAPGLGAQAGQVLNKQYGPQSLHGDKTERGFRSVPAHFLPSACFFLKEHRSATFSFLPATRSHPAEPSPRRQSTRAARQGRAGADKHVLSAGTTAWRARIIVILPKGRSGEPQRDPREVRWPWRSARVCLQRAHRPAAVDPVNVWELLRHVSDSLFKIWAAQEPTMFPLCLQKPDKGPGMLSCLHLATCTLSPCKLNLHSKIKGQSSS